MAIQCGCTAPLGGGDYDITIRLKQSYAQTKDGAREGRVKDATEVFKALVGGMNIQKRINSQCLFTQCKPNQRF